ncbi:hypothetical protein B0H34DRAFT_850440 [Crassisporium funariophilum]|nr:hypothetical protein B0H34DRAFT_850440 [Crassisporium funariophilum]
MIIFIFGVTIILFHTAARSLGKVREQEVLEYLYDEISKKDHRMITEIILGGKGIATYMMRDVLGWLGIAWDRLGLCRWMEPNNVFLIPEIPPSHGTARYCTIRSGKRFDVSDEHRKLFRGVVKRSREILWVHPYPWGQLMSAHFPSSYEAATLTTPSGTFKVPAQGSIEYCKFYVFSPCLCVSKILQEMLLPAVTLSFDPYGSATVALELGTMPWA